MQLVLQKIDFILINLLLDAKEYIGLRDLIIRIGSVSSVNMIATPPEICNLVLQIGDAKVLTHAKNQLVEVFNGTNRISFDYQRLQMLILRNQPLNLGHVLDLVVAQV